MAAVSSSSSSSGVTATEDSLWLRLLRESSSRTAAPEATCLVVGDDIADKKTLLSALAPPAFNLDTFHSPLEKIELITNLYFEIDDNGLEAPAKINMWGFDSKVFPHAVELVKPAVAPASPSKLAFIITLDLTKDEQVLCDSLKFWLRQLSEFSAKYHDLLPAEQSKAQKQLLSKYLSSVRMLKGEKLSKPEETDDKLNNKDTTAANLSSESRFEFAVEKLSVPVLVVGLRSDMLNFNDITTLKSMKELQGKLRLLCLEAGASLSFTNAATEELSNGVRRYLLHRLFPESVSMQLEIEVRSSPSCSKIMCLC